MRLLPSLAVACAALLGLLGTTPPAPAEIVDLPRSFLPEAATVILVGECTLAESTAETRGGMRHTEWSHRLRVDRVERDPSGTIRVGDEVTLHSWNDAWTGGDPPPAYGSGHRGLPAKGERRRVYLRSGAASPGAADARPRLDVVLPNGWQPEGRSIVLVGADDEYRSEVTMPLLSETLTRDAGASTVVCLAADPATGVPDVANRAHIASTDALRHCDVAVLFMRWREPDAETLSNLRWFLGSGAPVVGLRTSTHMLRAAAAGADPAMNDEWPTRVFGQRWISHHGHDTRTRILAPEESVRGHPILRGVAGDVVVPSWLYDVEPLPKDCTVLLWGEVAPGTNASPAPARQPILWVRERGPETPAPFAGGRAARRMAFTTLGHPGDFAEPQVRRLVEQMVLWAAGDETTIPADGVKAEAPGYVPPATR